MIALTTIDLAKEVVRSADAYAMLNAQLKNSTGSAKEAAFVLRDLYGISQKSQMPLEASVKLYARMSAPMEKMGLSAAATSAHIEYMMDMLKLNGVTAGEAASVMLQYSQSVNAGRLNGGEFNAVAEAAPGILRAIEAELRATGQWGENTTETLKQMGSKGEISFDLMHRAAMRALPEVRKQMENMPRTFDGAITNLKSAWFIAMGEMGKDTSFNSAIISIVKSVEDNIPSIVASIKSMVEATKWLIDNSKELALVFGVIGSIFVGSMAAPKIIAIAGALKD